MLDSFDRLAAAIKQAEDLKRRAEYRSALEVYRQTLSARTGELATPPNAFTHADLVLLERHADLEILFGHTAIADDLLAALVAILQAVGNRFYADYALLKRLHLALECGAVNQAHQLLRSMESLGDLDAVEISPAGLSRWERQLYGYDINNADRAFILAHLYLNMGRLWLTFGQYGEALVLLKRALHYAGKETPVNTQALVLQTRLCLAAAVLEKGEFLDAQEALATLEASLQQTTEVAPQVRYLELIGKFNLLTGKMGGALAHFTEVVKICSQHHFEAAAIQAMLNLCEVLILVNQTPQAKIYLAIEVANAQRLGNVALLGRAEFLLGMAEARSHSLADAVPLASLSEIWKVGRRTTAVRRDWLTPDPLEIPQASSYLAFFEDRAMAFHWYLGAQDFATAAQILQRIKETFLLTDSALILCRVQILEGVLAYYQQDYANAERLLNDVRGFLRALGLQPELWQVLRFLGWCWKYMERAPEEQEALAGETLQVLTTMTESLEPAEQAIFLLNKWTADEEYIAGEINRLMRLKAQLANVPWYKKLQLRRQLWQAIHDLLEHIDRYKDALARRVIEQRETKIADGQSQTLWQRLWQHPRQRVTLSFLVLPDRVFIVRAGWLSLDFGISPVTRIGLRQLVRQWHEPIQRFIGKSRGLGKVEDQTATAKNAKAAKLSLAEVQQIMTTVSAQLAEALRMEELLSALPKRINALTIVPDDSLHGLPFAALMFQGRYLIERFAVALAFESRRPASLSPSPTGEYALTVGVSKGAPGYPPLDGARRELQKVSAWLARHQAIEQRLDDTQPANGAADKATVLRLLEQASLFHIACHGEFKINAPEQSGLVLIQAPDKIETVSLRELAAMNLQRLKHTTLSSCWSADNYVVPGRWIISLPETLWRAGAESVLGCLWLVSDEVAVALMNLFYNYLDHYPRDEALRRAQLDCLNNRLSDCRLDSTTNPLFWAGYHLYGNPQPLRLPKSSTKN